LTHIFNSYRFCKSNFIHWFCYSTLCTNSNSFCCQQWAKRQEEMG